MKAIVFPGQGSQYVGMGKDFYDAFSEAKEVFHEVDDALGFKLSNIILNGPKENLDLTENTQPAIMTVGVSIYRIFKKHKIKDLKEYLFFAGHSLGEYTSLVCSDSLTLKDGARILKARGKSMQDAVPVNVGAMAAVLGAELDLINEVIKKHSSNEGIAEISNDNCPGQIVISGSKDKINKIVDDLKSNYSKKAILLPVSAPFHCSLMKPSADKMNEILTKTEFKKPLINIVSNVTAKTIDNFKEIPLLLTKQITHHVRWRESVDFMSKNGVKHFIEIGPGKALTGMIKRIGKELTTTTIDNITQFNEFN
jgi:[acyl-carrier-protein] S-malonyltransferase